MCDYSDTYILVKGTIAVVKETAAAPNSSNEKVIFKNCAPFTSWIKQNKRYCNRWCSFSNTMYNVIEYSDNY